jgi:predicted  nucleic acid-binding Zn-ribbon protein
MEELLPELRSDVKHIQSDVTDIKAVARDTNAGLEKLRDRLDDQRKELSTKSDGLHRDVLFRFDGLNGKYDELRKEFTDRIEKNFKEAASDNAALRAELMAIYKDLGARIDAVKDSISKAKIQALMLYITLAGSTFALVARAFKWI